MNEERGTIWQRQILPLSLTFVITAVLVVVVYGQITFINHFTTNDISLHIHVADILIGLTVYLKTSIDFAIFIGNLMHTNRGWRNRISIELGTALGNALGTIAVLFVWTLVKEIDWLLAIMIVVAAIVLFKLAETGLEHAAHTDREYPRLFRIVVKALEVFLKHVNWFTAPFLKRALPNLNMNSSSRGSFWSLFIFAITIPFVLGLDDFAGYVPLFSIVNVFGFTIGVFLAHALLNMLLYISPERTIRAVKNPLISLVGSIAFIGLAAWGIFEAIRLIFG